MPNQFVWDRNVIFSLTFTQHEFKVTEIRIRFSISIEEEIVRGVDEEIGRRRGFSNRSQGISYCVRQVLELEEYANGSISFMMDFLDLIEGHPEIGESYLAFLREERRRREG